MKIIHNPSNSFDEIQISGLEKDLKYELFSPLGQLIKRGRTAKSRIRLNNLLTPGVYLLKLFPSAHHPGIHNRLLIG